MNPVLTTGAAVLTLATRLALTHVPLGTWVHRVFTDDQDWRLERRVHRLVGVDPRTEQRWAGYAVSVVAFSVVSVAALFLLIEVQGWLPWLLGRSSTPSTRLWALIGQDRVNVTELDVALQTADPPAGRQ